MVHRRKFLVTYADVTGTRLKNTVSLGRNEFERMIVNPRDAMIRPQDLRQEEIMDQNVPEMQFRRNSALSDLANTLKVIQSENAGQSIQNFVWKHKVKAYLCPQYVFIPTFFLFSGQTSKSTV
jgi:hypothetical protein